ncbi:MAG: aminotransferase class I/II-fold pyridoxal phosphate-dependent enzyme [bacterium]|nr:aminotransferase class I/II-fold pyridoxal phosphate-dependent enzyme [bacterium]
MISKRALSIDSSGIRKVFALAASIDNPINLSIGQPDFFVPELIKDQAIAAIRENRNGYTQTNGLLELRQHLASSYPGLAERGEDIFISSGVSGGLFLAYAALLDPGDEVLVPDPYFCMYRDLALLLNAQPVYYDTYPDFRPTLAQLEASYSSRTKLLVLNSPGNPTGYVYSPEELDEILEWAKKKDIWVISDEIYSSFSYDDLFASAWGKYDKLILLDGFSKSHGCTGWRVGWAVGPKNVIEQMLKIQQYTFVCAPAPLQAGLVCDISEQLQLIREQYRAKRDLLVEGLKSHYQFVKPGGAFYLFPEVPAGDGASFVARCIENKLLVVPGNVFSRRDTHFRISFAASDETLQRGVEVLRKLV